MTLGLVPAAGRSERMGAPKLALPFGGSTVLRTVVANLFEGGCDGVRVVLGHHIDLLAPLLAHTRAEIVVNEQPEAGMLSSVQAGLASFDETVRAVVLLPGDMPHVRAETVWSVLTEIRSGGDLLVACHEGRRGHPLVLSRRAAERARSLPSDAKLSDLLHDADLVLREVPTDDPGVLRDLDAPADYRPE